MDMPFGVLNDRLAEAALLSGTPLNGQLELTPRCNYRCRMCYVNQAAGDERIRTRELPAVEWLRIGRGFRDMGMLNVLLTGGEPFLRPDFLPLYADLHDLGLVMTVFTNASLVTPQAAAALARRRPHAVYVSLYGATDAVSDSVTGCRDSLTKTLEGVRCLRAARIPVILRTTLVRQNQAQLGQMAAIAESFGVPFGMNELLFSRRDPLPENVQAGSAPSADWRLDAEEMEQVLQAFGERLAGRDSGRAQLVTTDVGARRRHTEPGSAFTCSAARTSFWVTWDGMLTPCASLRTPSVRLEGLGMREAWEQLRQGCAAVPACEACLSCPDREFCETCPAYSFAETGRFDLPAPFLCERYKGRHTHHDGMSPGAVRSSVLTKADDGRLAYRSNYVETD